MLDMLDGRLEDALVAANQLRSRSEELGSPGFGQLWGALLSMRPLLYLGRGEEALASLEGGLGTFRQLATKRPLCLAHLGRRGEAQSLLRELMGDWIIQAADSLLEPLECAVLIGDRESAATLAERLADAGIVMGNPEGAATCVARHLGGAALLMGDREAARAHYERAIADATKLRFRPELALANLALFELLLDGDGEDRASALSHLDFAIEELRAMKMQPALERALGHKGLLHA